MAGRLGIGDEEAGCGVPVCLRLARETAGGLGKQIGGVPSAPAILDRFLHHAEIIYLGRIDDEVK